MQNIYVCSFTYLNIVLLGVSNRLKSCFGQSPSENLKHKRPVYVGGALLYRWKKLKKKMKLFPVTT